MPGGPTSAAGALARTTAPPGSARRFPRRHAELEKHGELAHAPTQDFRSGGGAERQFSVAELHADAPMGELCNVTAHAVLRGRALERKPPDELRRDGVLGVPGPRHVHTVHRELAPRIGTRGAPRALGAQRVPELTRRAVQRDASAVHLDRSAEVRNEHGVEPRRHARRRAVCDDDTLEPDPAQAQTHFVDLAREATRTRALRKRRARERPDEQERDHQNESDRRADDTGAPRATEVSPELTDAGHTRRLTATPAVRRLHPENARQ